MRKGAKRATQATQGQDRIAQRNPTAGTARGQRDEGRAAQLSLARLGETGDCDPIQGKRLAS